MLLTVHMLESHRQANVKTGGPRQCRKQHRSLPHTTLPLPTGSVNSLIALVAARAAAGQVVTRQTDYPEVARVPRLLGEEITLA